MHVVGLANAAPNWGTYTMRGVDGLELYGAIVVLLAGPLFVSGNPNPSHTFWLPQFGVALCGAIYCFVFVLYTTVQKGNNCQVGTGSHKGVMVG
jgi:hypothetical protein